MKTTTDVNGVVSDALVRRLTELLLVNNATGISAQQIFDTVQPFIGTVWFPIGTAPKDGTIVTLFSERSNALMLECKWSRGHWCQWGVDDCCATSGFSRLESYEEPSHWMRVLPPNAADEQRRGHDNAH